MSYFNFKKRAPKVSDRSKLVRKLDEIFSEYIRIRNSDPSGCVICITCGDKHHWTDVDCGHFVKRGNMATRWHLQNSGGQCRLCNSTHDGKEDLHAEAIDTLYGPGTAESLRQLGKGEKHFMDYELQGMYEELRKEVKALKQEKGWTLKSEQ